MILVYPRVLSIRPFSPVRQEDWQERNLAAECDLAEESIRELDTRSGECVNDVNPLQDAFRLCSASSSSRISCNRN